MKQIGPHTKGVYIISVTPFTDDGDIDWKSIDTLVEFYIAKGVTGVTILGVMGEAQKLTETESAAVAKYFIDRVASRVPVIVGVSNAAVDNLVELGKCVMDFGAGGITAWSIGASVLPGLSVGHRCQYFGAGILTARRRSSEPRYVQTRGLAWSEQAATDSARL